MGQPNNQMHFLGHIQGYLSFFRKTPPRNHVVTDKYKIYIFKVKVSVWVRVRFRVRIRFRVRVRLSCSHVVVFSTGSSSKMNRHSIIVPNYISMQIQNLSS